jgi:hypothetical protein
MAQSFEKMRAAVEEAGQLGYEASLPKYSLTATILRYKAEWSSYLANSLEADERGEADGMPSTYQPSSRAIASWERPAERPHEAIMALQLALEDYEMGDTPRIPSMIKAALGYLEASVGESRDVGKS